MSLEHWAPALAPAALVAHPRYADSFSGSFFVPKDVSITNLSSFPLCRRPRPLSDPHHVSPGPRVGRDIWLARGRTAVDLDGDCAADVTTKFRRAGYSDASREPHTASAGGHLGVPGASSAADPGDESPPKSNS